MPSRYAGTGFQATTADTAFEVLGAAAARAGVYHVQVLNGGTPEDAVLNCIVQEVTTAGTGTAVTPTPLDVQDRAAVTTAAEEHSAEPTYTAVEVLMCIFNARSMYQWYAQEGGEFWSNAATSSGWGCVYVSGGTPVINVVFHWRE